MITVALFWATAFPGLDTFSTLVPMEFDALPEEVMVAGYPWILDENYRMGFSIGAVLGVRGEHDQILDFDIYCGRFAGSPIWYFNRTAGAFRMIGITTWHLPDENSGVRLTTMNRENIIALIDASLGNDYPYYPYVSYVPFLKSGGSNTWTGVAVSNHNSISNNIKVEYFSQDGKASGMNYFSLQPYAQQAVVAQTLNPTTGWIKISSSAPHTGLALIGQSQPSVMFDLDFKSSLHKNLVLSHLAADNQTWESYVMACNPNDSAANVTYTYYDQAGNASQTQVVIPANGSIQDPLYARFAKNLNGGHMVMQSSQPIAAFLLYDSSAFGSNTWTAGLSALPME